MKKITKQILAGIMAVMVLLSLIPFNIFAAPVADIPSEMLDNAYLDALAYTGYEVKTQKDNGTIFNTYGSSAPASVRSDIGYGTSATGLETVNNSSTVTGKAPDISLFESQGLCCASYVTYVYYNYLPNIAGVDTSVCPPPTNTKLAQSYNDVAIGWVNGGRAREIAFTQNSNGSNFVPSEGIPLGSLIVFQQIKGGRISHVAIYAGEYNGNKGYKAVINTLKGRVFEDDNQFELSLGLFTEDDRENYCNIYVLPMEESAKFMWLKTEGGL